MGRRRVWIFSPAVWVRLSMVGLFVFAFAWSQRSAAEAVLAVIIEDAATGRPTPVRVRITDTAGQPVLSESAVGISRDSLGIPEAALAVMYGHYDRATGYALQPDGSFYVDGSFDVSLAPGSYRLTISKGYEYIRHSEELTLRPGERLSRNYRLQRWIHMPERGWYSGDAHIHLRRSPREDPLILRWIAAEDVHVGHLLEMGDFWQTYYAQYAFGEKGRYQEGLHILSSGQEEPRTPEIGHTISLGAEELVRFRDQYYYYDKVFDRVRELGGITGFAHHAMTFHGYRGMTLFVLQNKIDFLQVLEFCYIGGPFASDQYYHYLDLGFRLTALGGSDFPWCGRGPRFGLEEGCSQIGDARFYAYTGMPGQLSFPHWLDAVKAGRTFVTSGPMLELTVNGQLPGDTVEVRPGSKVRVSARALGHAQQIPLESLRIVAHGKVIQSVSAGESGQTSEQLTLDFELPVERGVWIAALATAAHTQVAHTTPVYVTIDGGGFHNPDTAPHYLALSEQYMQELEQELASPGDRMDNQAFRYKEGLEERIARVREIMAELAARLE